MVYTPKTDWDDSPATTTPITAAELIRMEQGIAQGAQDASTSQKGNVELATPGEMTTGADLVRVPPVKTVVDYIAGAIVDAGGGSVVDASQTVKGIVELATAGELAIGTDTVRVPPVNVVKDYVTGVVDSTSAQFNNLLDVVAPIATYGPTGELLTPGPQTGDMPQFDELVGKYVVGPYDPTAGPLDQRYAEANYTPPWYRPTYIVENSGQTVPDEFPADGIIIDTTVLNEPLLENVNSISAATGTIQLPGIDVATVNDLTLTGNVTLALPAAVAGSHFAVRVRQNATGTRTVTWPSNITWPGVDPDVPPTLLTTANTQARYRFVSDGGTRWTCESFVQYAAASGSTPATAPTVRGAFGSNQGLSGISTTSVATLPGTIASGDVGYAVVSTTDTLDPDGVTPTTLTPPSGWTIVGSPLINGNFLIAYLIQRTMNGTEDGTTITATFAESGRPAITGIIVAGGTQASDVIEPLADTSSDASIDTPLITPPVDQCLLVHLAALRCASSATVPTITPAAGYSERLEHNEGRLNVISYGGYVETRSLSGQAGLQQPSASATPSVNVTDLSWLIAVPPA